MLLILACIQPMALPVIREPKTSSCLNEAKGTDLSSKKPRLDDALGLVELYKSFWTQLGLIILPPIYSFIRRLSHT